MRSARKLPRRRPRRLGAALLLWAAARSRASALARLLAADFFLCFGTPCRAAVCASADIQLLTLALAAPQRQVGRVAERGYDTIRARAACSASGLLSGSCTGKLCVDSTTSSVRALQGTAYSLESHDVDSLQRARGRRRLVASATILLGPGCTCPQAGCLVSIP